MSDIPSGITKVKNPTEDLLKEVNKSILQLNKRMETNTGIMQNMFLAVGGKPDAAKNMFKLQEDYFKRQETKDKLDEKFGTDFQAMLKYMKAIAESPIIKKGNAALDRQQKKDLQKNVDSGFLGKLGEEIYSKILGGNFKPKQERAHENAENINHAYSIGHRNLVGYYDKGYFGENVGGNGGGDESSGGGGGLPGITPQKGKGRYQKKMDRINGGRGGGGGIHLEAYGQGKEGVSAGEVAHLPFLISGPPLLLHHDLKEMLEIQRKAQVDASWKSGGGGGGIEGLLAGAGIATAIGAALPGILAVALPALGIIAGVAGLALLISAAVSDTKKRQHERDATLASLTPEQIAALKAKGITTTPGSGMSETANAQKAIATGNAADVDISGSNANSIMGTGSKSEINTYQEILKAKEAKRKEDERRVGNPEQAGNYWMMDAQGNYWYSSNASMSPSAKFMFDDDSQKTNLWQKIKNSESGRKLYSKLGFESSFFDQVLQDNAIHKFHSGGEVNATLQDGESVIDRSHTNKLNMFIDSLANVAMSTSDKSTTSILEEQNELLREMLKATNMGNDILKNSKAAGSSKATVQANKIAPPEPAKV